MLPIPADTKTSILSISFEVEDGLAPHASHDGSCRSFELKFQGNTIRMLRLTRTRFASKTQRTDCDADRS